MTVINVFLGWPYVGWVAALAGPGTGGLALTSLRARDRAGAKHPAGAGQPGNANDRVGSGSRAQAGRCGRPENQAPSRGGGPDVSRSGRPALL